MTTMKSRRSVVGTVGLLFVFVVGPLAAQDTAVVITYAAPDANQTILFVNGENFANGARVFLAGNRLNGVLVDVVGKSMTAQLPLGLPSGSYLVQVSNGETPREGAAFVVLLGEVGPAGPAGPPGPPGPPGPSSQTSAPPDVYNYFLGASGNLSMTGARNTGLGAFSLSSNITGHDNTAAGVSALASNTHGYNNTALGVMALYSNDTGFSNTATGVLTLSSNSTGSYNTAMGEAALGSNTNGTFNTGMGWLALGSNTTGINNSAFGVATLRSNTTGTHNTAHGVDSLAANTTGHYNTAVGVSVLNRSVSGSQNTGVGGNSLNAALGSFNTAAGFSALTFVTSGDRNTAVGRAAGAGLTTGSYNTFMGMDSGYSAQQKINAVNSMALGYASYTTKDNQVVIGNASVLETLLRGNVGIGTTAPSQRLDVIGSIAIPPTTSSTSGVIYKGTTPFIHDYAGVGSDGLNTFVGLDAGNFTLGTGGGDSLLGSDNSGFGHLALHAVTTGKDNTALAKGALSQNTVGNWNTAVGADASRALINGNGNVAVGVDALLESVDGSENTAVGKSALNVSVHGAANAAFGNGAMAGSLGGSENVAIGYQSLLTVYGHQNVSVGSYAGYSLTTATFNTFIGQESGRHFGQKSDATNSTAIGNATYTTADNQVVIGNESVTETLLRGNVGIGTTAPSSKLEVNGTADAKGYKVSGVMGVSCFGPPSAAFLVVNGIVTRC